MSKLQNALILIVSLILLIVSIGYYVDYRIEQYVDSLPKCEHDTDISIRHQWQKTYNYGTNDTLASLGIGVQSVVTDYLTKSDKIETYYCALPTPTKKCNVLGTVYGEVNNECMQSLEFND